MKATPKDREIKPAQSGPSAGTTIPRSTSDAKIPEGQVTLLLYQSDRVEAVRLALGDAVVVGREEADVVLADKNLSRRHARFRFESDGVWVDDLESTNGTRVDGKRIQSCRLSEESEVALGDVAITLHVNAPPESGLRSLASERRFSEMVASELVRAQVFRRGAVVLRVGLAPGDETPLPRWYPALRDCLKPVHALGVWGRRGVQILLPESDHVQAQQLARSIIERVGLDLRIGGVCVPTLLTSALDVLEEAGRAQLRASYRSPVELVLSDDEPVASATEPALSSPKMRAVVRDIERVASADVPVLLLGETGVGKEVAARSLHARSLRADKPFRCVNCGAIPGQLIESAFFGHERGAFTGADRRVKGVFEQAEGGTVLLDEIGELPLVAQAALLRVLETKRVTRVGSAEDFPIDVRVVATTHRDLEGMSARGEFREDLWFRLNTVTLTIPPLRARVDDILPLAQHFLRVAIEMSGARPVVLGVEATARLLAYPWPGNVRELRNEMERAAVLADGDEITPDDFSERVRGGGAPKTEPAPQPPLADLKAELRRYEAELIARALEECDWNQSEAARRLNMPRRTLVHKIRQLGIRRPGS